MNPSNKQAKSYTSLFDLFSIGIGPSSSHSVGPMRAARVFLDELQEQKLFSSVSTIDVHLYGSLALTGKGHGTDRALVLGLLGFTPESIDPDQVATIIETVQSQRRLLLDAQREIEFDIEQNIMFDRKTTLPQHPNGMTFLAKQENAEPLLEKTCFSIGGGFVVDDQQTPQTSPHDEVPFPFDSAAELMAIAESKQCPISRIIWENELSLRPGDEVRANILNLWKVMQECVERGCRETGILPGGLKVQRRAAELLEKLQSNYETKQEDPLNVLDWVDLFALAVNEENAAGGRVVTAPTNGAAGIIPAVLHYYDRFVPGANEDGIVKFFLTAAAIGMLYKKNASISGAEVGCQGEVGVACSMAAGALTEVLGGSVEQVEQAAEIGMEHNLGLTCDPIGGLVQVPCIERNAMGAVKAINASRMALRSNGKHRVSLDKVIKTMRRTGEDMSSKYKETSRGGLAVNITEC